jgi:hypothetical protein
MQLMPQTAELLKCDWTKIEDPAVNVDCGVKFVAALLTYTKGDLLKAISGYNGGTHSTEKSVLMGGRIADNKETKAYVKSVLNFFEHYKAVAAAGCPGSSSSTPAPPAAPSALNRPSPSPPQGTDEKGVRKSNDAPHPPGSTIRRGPSPNRPRPQDAAVEKGSVSDDALQEQGATTTVPVEEGQGDPAAAPKNPRIQADR